MSNLRIAKVVPLVGAWRVDRTFDYSVPDDMSERIAIGSLVRIVFGRRRVRGIVVELSDKSDVASPEPITGLVLDVPVVPGKLIDLARWVGRRYVVTLADALARFVPQRVRVSAAPSEIGPGPEPSIALAYEGGSELIHALSTGGAGTWCFRTLPNEDRATLIAELVSAGSRSGYGAAIIAVPEVRYGSIVLERLAQHFPAMVRIDSARDDAERARATIALARGHRLGAGGRASVFAPVPDLRLLVIDDEHHSSFKEDRTPRYDARRVAIERARLQGAVCVLMSATPSLDTAFAAREGRFGSVFPVRDTERAARPVVEVVELPSDRALSGALHERIRDELRGGGKVGLLVARAGFSTALWCATCKRSLRCPRCETGISYDRSRRRVRCVRCGFVSDPPDVCPTCGASDYRFVGAGSERLAEQVQRSFPRARVARMDPDVLESAGPLSSDPDIYVTTWIGTKPELRPPVSLVAVLDADALIRRIDFRAAEQAHEVLSEMAEWAGPASDGGRLVIQTSEPAHHSVQAVARADPGYFWQRELPLREELRYPPFSELIRATARGTQALDLAREAADVCRGHGAQVLGPVTLGPAAGDDAGAVEFLAKCDDALVVADDLRGILAGSSPGTRLSVDTDPR